MLVYKKLIIKFLKLVLASFLFILLLLIILGGGYGKPVLINLSNKKPLLFAHRGVIQKNVVENTRKAFELSKKYDFKAVETDLNITKDGKLIIFHDENLKRLLHIDTSIYQVEWEFIKNKNLYYGDFKTNQKILSFESFLNVIDTNTIVYLDIKKNSLQVADSLLMFFDSHPSIINNIMIADESFLFLNYLRFKNKNITLAWEGFNKGKEWLYFVIPKNFKLDYYASFFDKVNENQMHFFKSNDLITQKIVYTINKNNFDKAVKLGLYNLILDYSPEMGTYQELIDKILQKETM